MIDKLLLISEEKRPAVMCHGLRFGLLVAAPLHAFPLSKCVRDSWVTPEERYLGLGVECSMTLRGPCKTYKNEDIGILESLDIMQTMRPIGLETHIFTKQAVTIHYLEKATSGIHYRTLDSHIAGVMASKEYRCRSPRGYCFDIDSAQWIFLEHSLAFGMSGAVVTGRGSLDILALVHGNARINKGRAIAIRATEALRQ